MQCIKKYASKQIRGLGGGGGGGGYTTFENAVKEV